MNIENKTILITGAAGGIGSDIVKTLLNAGATVGAVDYNKKNLKKLYESVPHSKKESLNSYFADIRKFEDVQSTVDSFYDKYKSIDILINNVGILKDGLLISIGNKRIDKYPISDWDNTLKTNLYSYFFFTREVAEKMMLHRTKGLIINVSSVSATGNSGQTAYATSKGAINSLTVTWSQELAKFGIRVAGVSPGLTNTNMLRDGLSDERLDKLIGNTPLGRIATPKEITKSIVFIIENDFFCGRTLEIDGGLRM